MANGNGTTNGGVSWASVIDRGLDGWFAYLNRPRGSPSVQGQIAPYGPSASDATVAALNAQLAAQQQNQKMLMLAGGAALVVYLLSK